jgi:DNA-3-methyladenine glycosylase I
MPRCPWAASEPNITYHDEEWGVPVHDDRKLADVPARTPESDAMSRDLLKRGFKFVGSTICYALMQATGLVNDHLVTCPRHAELSDISK